MTFLLWLDKVLTVPNVMLWVLMALALVVLISASRVPHFRLGDMIMDEHGKASSSRVSLFIALGLSSYMLAYITITDRVDGDTLLYMYGVYLITWASSKTLDKAVGIWASRGGQTQQTSEPRYSNRPVSYMVPPDDPRR